MLVAQLAMWGAGKGAETAEWSINRWVLEGIDRSGVTGATMDQMHTVSAALGNADKLIGSKLGGSLGLESEFQPLTRMQNRNLQSKLLGPSGGLASDVPTAISGATQFLLGDGITKNELRSLERLAPSYPFLNDMVRANIDNAAIPADRKYKRKKGKASDKSVLFID